MRALQSLQIQMLHGTVIDFCMAFAQMSHDGTAECAGTYTSRSRKAERSRNSLFLASSFRTFSLHVNTKIDSHNNSATH